MTPFQQLPMTFPPIDLFPRKKTIEDLPQREFLKRGFKIFMLGSLAWDYTDTVLDMMKHLRLPDETKKVTRRIRNLKEDYDHVHSKSLSKSDITEEKNIAEQFEDLCREHLNKLVFSLNNEKIVADVIRDHKILVNSIQQALTVIDTMKIYAAKCDRWIKDNGVHGVNSILPVHFIHLSKLLPLLAGDCYNPDSEARRITARILFKELDRVELYDEIGQL